MRTIALLGHTEHGKTTLAQAIAGRGAAFTVGDPPGPPPWDGAVLVVSAPDGVMPGSRQAIESLKVSHQHIPLVVFLSKCDLIDGGDEELLDLVEMEIREMIAKYLGRLGDTVTVVRGSAQRVLQPDHRRGPDRSVDQLIAALMT